jgi:hypothetical protein
MSSNTSTSVPSGATDANKHSSSSTSEDRRSAEFGFSVYERENSKFAYSKGNLSEADEENGSIDSELPDSHKLSTKQRPLSAEDGADFWSFLFMLWLNPLVSKGYKEGITHVDLGAVSKQDEVRGLYKTFWKLWLQHCQKYPNGSDRSLWTVLWQTVGVQRGVLGFSLYLLYCAVQFVPGEYPPLNFPFFVDETA